MYSSPVFSSISILVLIYTTYPFFPLLIYLFQYGFPCSGQTRSFFFHHHSRRKARISYGQKTGGGKRVDSTVVITMFRNTTYDIVPCTIISLHMDRHKSGGGTPVHSMYSSSTAVTMFGHNGWYCTVFISLFTVVCAGISREGENGSTVQQ